MPSLKKFIHKGFELINPCTPLMDNWHIDTMIDYLEAATKGKLQRLIINIPPRYMKSLVVNVAWPAWLLGEDPSRRIISASHRVALSEKHVFDSRSIMQSQYYKDTYPGTKIRKIFNTKRKFITSQNGFRLASSMAGTLLGEGGNFIIIDDPHHPLDFMGGHKGAAKVIEWFQSTLIHRLDDVKKGVIIVVMQRLDEEDLTGYLLKEFASNWETLILPVKTDKTQIVRVGRKSYCYQKGAYLHEERQGAKEIAQLQRELTAAKFVSMYLQKPMASNSGYFKVKWFKYYNYHELPPIDPGRTEVFHSIDIAYSDKAQADYTGYTIWLHDVSKHRFYLLDVMKLKLTYADLLAKIKETVTIYPTSTILVEIMQQTCIEKELFKYSPIDTVIEVRPLVDKRARVSMAAKYFEDGQVFIPATNTADNWVANYIKELTKFSNAKHDDQVDATTQFLIWAGNKFCNQGLIFKTHHKPTEEVNVTMV